MHNHTAARRSSLVSKARIFVWLAIVLAGTALLVQAQQRQTQQGQAQPSELPKPEPGKGCCGQAYHAAEFQVASAAVSVPFYADVLGLEYPQGWTGKLNPPAGGSNQQLTGASQGLWRVISLPIPGASWHMQIVETTGMDRKALAPRRQDIGATGFILYVRNLDVALAALNKAKAPIVTTGGKPVSIGGKSRAILAKDPDGFFIELRQMDPLPKTSAPASSNVIDARMAISIADTDQTARYWRELLGFDVKPGTFTSDSTELALHGTPGAQVRKSIASIPPSGKLMYHAPGLIFEFLEFKNIERTRLAPRYQDPGAGGFVVRLSTGNSGIRGKEMADFVKQAHAMPQARILTSTNDALDQGRRFAIFTQDLNGFIMEVTQSVLQ